MKNALTLILLVAFAATSSLTAQTDEDKVIVVQDPNERAPSLSVGLLFGSPQGDFNEIYDGIPVGLGGALLFNLGESPLEVGGGFGWQNMGSNSQDISIFSGVDSEGDEIYEHGNINVNNNIYTYHAIGRIKPFSGRIQVYGDILGGFKTYTTKTKIESDDSAASESIEDRKEARDFATSYGWAAGVKIRLIPAMAIEARFSNLRGGKTSYVDPESIFIDDEGNLDYELNESSTDIMIFQLGVSFEF